MSTLAELRLTASEDVWFSHIRDQRHKSARSAGDLADWLTWLELGGVAPITLENYEWAIARLLRTYPDRQLHEFTASEIGRVLRTFPPRSRRIRKAAYDGWFGWAHKTRRIPFDPIDDLPRIPREKQRAIDIFGDAEIALLTALPNNDGDLFLILFDTGLRRGEACALQARDCILERAELVVKRGKGGKDRVVPMTMRLVQRLLYWFEVDALRPTDHLWPIHPGGGRIQRTTPMGDTSFTVWYQDALEQAGVRYRNPHTTRHTYATRWLRKGGRLETLSPAMGHASIRTTSDIYAHLDLRDLKKDLALIEAAENDFTDGA